MESKTILYIGGFLLPDKNAAAHRVMGIAKIFRDLGHKVIFLNKSGEMGDGKEIRHVQYNGFECYEIPKETGKYDLLNSLFEIDSVVKVIETVGKVDMVIAYNYPAIALARVLHYCHTMGAKCIADVADWHGVSGRSLAYKLIKGSECALRMRCVHKKLDGLIVISDYLENYYKKERTINIPPLVDCGDEKWNTPVEKENNGTVFVYAGSPSSEKERLDIILDAIGENAKKDEVIINIIGITEEQYEKIYGRKVTKEMQRYAKFMGRLPHQKVIDSVKKADYTILIRDNNRVTQAGFPTKFVESISAETPVICNNSSNIKNYITENENGYLVSIDTLKDDLEKILEEKKIVKVNNTLFDYRNYLERTDVFLNNIFEKEKGK